MGVPVLIIGKSGSGKSTSLRNFKADELGFVNVMAKPLPFRGKFNSTFCPLKKTDALTPAQTYKLTCDAISRTQRKAIVIDDFGYMLLNHFMTGKDGGGNKFDLFDDIASQPWKLIELVRRDLPDDKIVYFIMHEEQNEFGGVKPKTIGKMIDDKICLEGLFTIVLRCMFKDERHVFMTHMTGDDITKSPMGMFEEDEINNDLKLVDAKIRAYYDMQPLDTKDYKEPEKENE